MKHLYSRILMLVVAALALLLVAVVAQQGQGQSSSESGAQHGGLKGRARNHQRQQILAKRLNLTEQQKQQFQQINQTFRQQAKAIHNDSSLGDAEKKQKLQDLRKQSVQQRMSILTPEQQQELKKIREEHRQEKGGDKTSQNKPQQDNNL